MYIIRRTVALFLVAALTFCCFCAVAEGDEWSCPQCGELNNMNFCIKCGTKKPESIVCPSCGFIYAFNSGVVYCGNCGTKMLSDVPPAVRYEGDGFDTPEEALAYYMEGLKNLNIEQMLKAFAWETQIEHYDIGMNLRRLRVWNISLIPGIPSANDFLREVNTIALRDNQARQIYYALEAYILGDDDLMSGYNIDFQSEEEIDEFLTKFDNNRLEELSRMSDIHYINPAELIRKNISDQKIQDSIRRETAQYGADEIAYLAGVADVGNEKLFCCPTIARYGNKWYLVTVNSFFSNYFGISSIYQAFSCGILSPDNLQH